MSDRQPTVRLSRMDGHNALWLTYDHEVKSEDVRAAMADLNSILDRLEKPIHVIVDLRSDPNVPLGAAVDGVLSGPLRHAMMGKWILIGSNWRIDMISTAVRKVQPDPNSHWCDTEEEAMAILQGLESSES